MLTFHVFCSYLRTNSEFSPHTT